MSASQEIRESQPPPMTGIGHYTSRRARRARVILQFTEQTAAETECVHEAAYGWAMIDGPWLVWAYDDDTRWHHWPMQHVLCVEWESCES